MEVSGRRRRAVHRQPGTGSYMGKHLMTVEQVVEELGVSRSTWDKWRAKGTAPEALRLPNGSLRIRRDALEAWLAGLAEAA